MAVELCQGCGVGDDRPKHHICYSQTDTRTYHADCFHALRPEGCAICWWGTVRYVDPTPRKRWWQR